MHPAVPQEEDLSISGGSIGFRFEIEPDGTVIVITVILSVAIGKVPVVTIFTGLAGKDGVGPQIVNAGTDYSRKHDQNVKALSRIGNNSHSVVVPLGWLFRAVVLRSAVK